jgi:Na+-transporting NADH:ubiquinone oxidoreductase subunit NqrB
LSAFSQADGAQPVLYDDGFLPPNNTIPPTVTKVSLDGGKTWQAVPAQGQVQYADSGLLGMLGDGSIVEAFRGKLFAWKAGDAAWHQVAPQLPGSFSNLLIFSNGAGTPATFWALTQGNSGYSFYLYQQK